MQNSRRRRLADGALVMTVLMLFACSGAWAQGVTMHITGFVFNDFNGDGILDPGENPITNPAAQFAYPDNAISLYDPSNGLVAIAASNAVDGYSDVIDYTTDIAGTWTVSAGIPPPGYSPTLPAGGSYTFDPVQTPTVTANFGFSNKAGVPEPGSLALLSGFFFASWLAFRTPKLRDR